MVVDLYLYSEGVKQGAIVMVVVKNCLHYLLALDVRLLCVCQVSTFVCLAAMWLSMLLLCIFVLFLL